MKALVLGLGNEILTDDGIGPRLVHDLAKTIVMSNVGFTTACVGGLEIMEQIEGYEKVVFIDAIHTSEGEPGDVFHFLASDFRETSNLSNLHDINFLTALELGRSLNIRVPSDLHIIAVKIIEDLEFSEEFTPALKEKYPIILQNVFELVRKILG